MGGTGHLSKEDGTSYCIDTGNSQAVELPNNVKPVQIGQSNKTYAYKSGTMIGKENQEAFTIRAVNPNGVQVGCKIRRLTPRECFRLQDFPETFKWSCSDSQAYKQAGNSITVGVLAKIIEKLKL